MTDTPKCSADRCDRRAAARGLCISHYQKKWRAGELETLPRLPQRIRDLEVRLCLAELQLARLIEKEGA